MNRAEKRTKIEHVQNKYKKNKPKNNMISLNQQYNL